MHLLSLVQISCHLSGLTNWGFNPRTNHAKCPGWTICTKPKVAILDPLVFGRESWGLWGWAPQKGTPRPNHSSSGAFYLAKRPHEVLARCGAGNFSGLFAFLWLQNWKTTHFSFIQKIVALFPNSHFSPFQLATSHYKNGYKWLQPQATKIVAKDICTIV